MKIFNKLLIDSANDLKQLHNSKYFIIIIFGFFGLLGLIIGYFGIYGILGFGGFLISWVLVYLINEIFDNYLINTRPKIQKKPIRLFINIILSIIIIYFLNDISMVIFLTLLCVNVIWKLDNRICSSFALGILFLIILFLLFGIDDKAEILAVWLYYFLLISAVGGIINSNKSENNNIYD